MSLWAGEAQEATTEEVEWKQASEMQHPTRKKIFCFDSSVSLKDMG